MSHHHHDKIHFQELALHEADRSYNRKGYALEHRAFRRGVDFLLDILGEIFIHPKDEKPFSYLSISLPQLKIKGAFMNIQIKRSQLKDAGDGVKFITGTLTPETDAGQIEKVKDGSVTAASDSDGAVVSLDSNDQLKWKAVIDGTKIPFSAKLSFTANADLVEGGSVDNIPGDVSIDFMEDEASKLVVGVDA
jgi:hypothetical protein